MRILLMLALSITAVGISAGSLTPPAAPTSTPAQEARVALPESAAFPITISQPGSYYLTRDVIVPFGNVGMMITASHVTLDMNGFRLAGVSDGLDGIWVEGSNVTIENGTVLGWGKAIVGTGIGLRLIGLRVEQAIAGIEADAQAVIEHCQVSGTSGFGIHARANSRVTDCVVTNFGTGEGIYLSGGEVLNSQVTTDTDVGTGIAVGQAGLIEGVVARGCTVGILTGNGIVRNSVVNSCGTGISASAGNCVVEGCAVLECDTGISAGGFSRIANNTVQSTGSATSIRTTTNAGTRIEGNQITGGATGIHVDTQNNLVIRNTFQGVGTPIGFGAGAMNNSIGPMVDVNSSSNPWGNVTY